jgi:hypothetical protein
MWQFEGRVSPFDDLVGPVIAHDVLGVMVVVIVPLARGGGCAARAWLRWRLGARKECSETLEVSEGD